MNKEKNEVTKSVTVNDLPKITVTKSVTDSNLSSENTVTKSVTIDLIPQTTISPSSINTYCKCPREYFYNYILKLPVRPNIHLIKGIMVHTTLENFFRGYKPNFDKTLATYFVKAWLSNKKQLAKLELSTEILKKERQDCINILKSYLYKFKHTINDLVEGGKAENESHAYYLLKPKFKELKVENEDLHCKGFIDRIHKDFDGNITLGDYKTSKKYGIGLTKDYRRQISIYALLYKLQEHITPDFTSVIYLRYGEEYFLEVTPSLLKYAREIIIDTYNKTRSINIEDYPKKENKLCSWCNFQNVCSGEKDWKSVIRVEKLKKLFSTPTPSISTTPQKRITSIQQGGIYPPCVGGSTEAKK